MVCDFHTDPLFFMKFQCPHCSQRIEVPSALLGQNCQCPTCQGWVSLPAATATPIPSEPTKARKPWLLLTIGMVLSAALGIGAVALMPRSKVQSKVVSRSLVESHATRVEPVTQPAAAQSSAPVEAHPEPTSPPPRVSPLLMTAKISALEGADMTARLEAITFLLEQEGEEGRQAVVSSLSALWDDPKNEQAFIEKNSQLMKAWRRSIPRLKEAEAVRIAPVMLNSLARPTLPTLMRAEALAALASTESGRAAVPYANQYITSTTTNYYLLAKSINLVSRFEPVRSLDLAESFLRHRDPSVRFAAIQAIASNAVPTDATRFLDVTHRVYLTDTNAPHKLAAGLILKRLMGEDDAFELFKKDAEKGPDILRNTVIRLMVTYGSRGIPVIKTHILQGNSEWVGLKAVVDIGPQAIDLLPEVEKLRTNPHPAVREMAEKAYAVLTAPQ